ncbi:uncharacterized protein PFLUO_LOCUS2758 [Penicillium psychrofluorescens]|uniref:uncharacterized protein n=1 Tax=Penicillium psychrofluorescens TaxID=3158075 RepID=UPI003CCDFCCF
MDPLPPPYSENDQGGSGPILRDDLPSYHQPASGSKTMQSATVKFPPSVYGYLQWKLTSTFHLGPTAEEKLFAASTHSNMFQNKPTVTLHDGPTDKDPIMATVHADKWGRARPIILTLPPRPGGSHEDAIVEKMSTEKHVSPTFTFETNAAGKGARRERFEWRQSRGNEISELSSGHSYGWKLVWLSGPVVNVGGNRKERHPGISSDGKEIVAILAHNMSWSMTKGFRFAFLGTGLTGTFGENWEILTVVSALQLWYKDVINATATA